MISPYINLLIGLGIFFSGLHSAYRGDLTMAAFLVTVANANFIAAVYNKD